MSLHQQQDLKSAIHKLFCLKFSFKFLSYARKQKWIFFSEHGVLSPFSIENVVSDICCFRGV